MKKILALILAAILALGMTACGAKQSSDLAVLWAEGDTATNPNTLINAMDRALYIEHISCKYYGAEGDAAKQIAQAQEALNAGAKLLLVEAIDSKAATAIADAAAAKGAAVLFFGNSVMYNQAFPMVLNDEARVSYFLNEMVTEFLKDNDTADRNGDGVITYGIQKDITSKNELILQIPGATEVPFNNIGLDAATAPDFIIAQSDREALYTLVSLQIQDYNTDKLVTQSIPIFTIGNTADFKEFVIGSLEHANELITRESILEGNKYLCDLTTVKEEDWAEMIFTTINVVDTGRITGTVIEDYDAMAESVAALAVQMLKGQNPGSTVTLIPYATYTK